MTFTHEDPKYDTIRYWPETYRIVISSEEGILFDSPPPFELSELYTSLDYGKDTEPWMDVLDYFESLGEYELLDPWIPEPDRIDRAKPSAMDEFCYEIIYAFDSIPGLFLELPLHITNHPRYLRAAGEFLMEVDADERCGRMRDMDIDVEKLPLEAQAAMVEAVCLA